jgi:hypothetical protein
MSVATNHDLAEQLRALLGLPKYTLRFVLTCEVDAVPTVQVTYLPERSESPITKSFELIEPGGRQANVEIFGAPAIRITETGTVEVFAGGGSIRGFESENTSCRAHAALALTWAIGELQRELMATLERPGAGIYAVD